jgi:hypothetical protein
MTEDKENDADINGAPEGLEDPITEQDQLSSEVKIEDNKTSEAEADTIGDSLPTVSKPHHSKLQKIKDLLKNKKFYIPSIIVVLVIAAVLIIPKTRYSIFGLFISQKYSISILDSQTKQPITAASIFLDGKSAATNNHGHATVNVKVGYHNLVISKKYYADTSTKVLVPISVHGTVSYTLKATGRQVPVTILNKVGGKPVSGVKVSAFGSVAITNDKGSALIVLPADKTSLAANITASGYNSLSATVHVDTKPTSQNTFSITPVGQIYFMSNLSGKLDVVKTNLDGSGRQTVLAGTGFEDTQNTVLLASRDWKYIALNSIRNTSGNSEINIINTATDKVTYVDSGNASFSSVGWIGHDFVYVVDRNDYSSWQPGASSIKSYTKTTTVLFSTNATGSSDSNAQYQSITDGGVEIIGNQVIYDTTWYAYPGYLSVPGQHDTLNIVNPDGTGTKTISSMDASTSYFSNMYTYRPNIIAIGVFNNSNNQSTYYEYNSDGSYASTTDPDVTNYNVGVPGTTYLLSPSSKQTFWSISADGQNVLYTGDQNGEHSTTIANLSPYSAFGWYTSQYVIVSKGGNELYIMPATGGTALKISDYFKANQNFYGYGSGYGAL